MSGNSKKLYIQTILFWIFFILFLGGCASIPTPQERQHTIDSIATTHHLQPRVIPAVPFSLYSLSDTSKCTIEKPLRVYIEGDGFAWATRSRLSNDPTPINPLGAKLMSIDPSHCKVYLARPCQYTGTESCQSDYWSSKRFSPEVLDSYNATLNRLKSQHLFSSISLVGYSGGGAIAALIAGNREDISELITVAGNIDTDAWVNYHKLSPLNGSLNPADQTVKLAKISQIHFIGGKDRIIPLAIYESYQRKVNTSDTMHSVICDECTHSNGWIERWASYLKRFSTLQK